MLGFITRWFSDIFTQLISIVAQGVLFATVPIARAGGGHAEDLIAMKTEVKTILRENALLEKFENNEIACPCCKEIVTFQNLGVVNQGEETLLYCRDPGCTLNAR